MTKNEWRIVRASVRGTSHVATAVPCQDACESLVRDFCEGTVAILVSADGAGSATHSDQGAELACAGLLGECADHLERRPLSTVDASCVENWFLGVHQAVAKRAAELGVSTRELACTLLIAIVGDDRAVFGQIGDGAIIMDDGTPEMGYVPATWPHSGEYANTTFFATEPEALRHLQVHVVADRRIQEVALFSDGIEKLALRMQSHEVHSPFFAPLFGRLRSLSHAEASELEPELRNFLDSSAVNARTDDDKTLVLATRYSARALRATRLDTLA